LELGLRFDKPADVFGSTDPRLFPVKQQTEQALPIILTAAVVAYEPEVMIIGGGNSAACPRRSAPSSRRSTPHTGGWASPTVT
jgi:hypothetical protein